MATNLFEFPRFSEVIMLIDVIAVRPCPDFQLDLEYKNDERRRFDMRPLLAMKPWNNQGQSKLKIQLFLSSGYCRQAISFNKG